jgi:plastocyanin
MRKLRTALVLIGLAALAGPALPAGAKPDATHATRIVVTAGKPSEFSFRLSRSAIPVGVVSFKVTNAGTIVHDFKIAGKKTRKLSPGQSQTITVRFRKAGSYRYLCTIPGHAAAGMKGVLKARSKAAAAVKLRATLTARQEVPRPKGAPAKAGGRFTATLTGKALHWRLTFGHLSGRATAAHIHLAPRGKAGPVLAALCAPCRSPRSGVARLTRTQIAALKKGRTYVNVHTRKNADGEIRGQIVRTPLTGPLATAT